MEVTRKLEPKEIAYMRRKHWVLLLMLPIVGVILYVLNQFDSLPLPARIAGMVISCLVVVIFSRKHFLLEQDLKKGIITTVQGTITEKRKMGGNGPRATSGISPVSARRSHSSSTFFLFIDDRKFNVPAKIYSKVAEGDRVCMEYFPKSQYYLDIRVEP